MQSKTKKLLAALIAAGIVPAAHAADIKLGVAEALSGGAAQYGGAGTLDHIFGARCRAHDIEALRGQPVAYAIGL